MTEYGPLAHRVVSVVHSAIARDFNRRQGLRQDEPHSLGQQPLQRNVDNSKMAIERQAGRIAFKNLTD
ncbi:hypothetical protein C2W62_09415 [Candidatus Entotheonella serta]|nr:hypothetical protein C2W62_09415 [Candidatus Entotheonella serta]